MTERQKIAAEWRAVRKSDPAIARLAWKRVHAARRKLPEIAHRILMTEGTQ